MRLSPEQRARLVTEATRLGVDPDELIAAAEEELGADDQGDTQSGPQRANPPDKAKAAAAEAKVEPSSVAKDPKLKPPLYQYHLPFVTVNEVRTIWLELPEVAGGDMNAAKYAAQQLAGDAQRSSESKDDAT